MIPRIFFPLLLAGLICCRPMAAENPLLVLDRPMPPPAWALMERELLRLNSEACEIFAAKYVDERGHLLHTPRWGTLDGPDDAIETFHNWTLLHALGASDSVLELFKKALEGHLHQYGQLRTTLTDLAREGAYHRDFITMSDWFHTGEGMRGFMFQGLSEPGSARLRERMKRFAGLYMNEDPEAPNYDPEHRIIRSIWMELHHLRCNAMPTNPPWPCPGMRNRAAGPSAHDKRKHPAACQTPPGSLTARMRLL